MTTTIALKISVHIHFSFTNTALVNRKYQGNPQHPYFSIFRQPLLTELQATIKESGHLTLTLTLPLTLTSDSEYQSEMAIE